METAETVRSLKIYISSTDKYKNSSLYEVIVYAAKEYGLTGATVLRGIMGFGSSSRVHSQKLLEINDKIPIIIEFIESKDKIAGFIEHIKPYIEESEKGCLITIQEVTIVLLKRGEKR
ncbi:MAG: DUF190 domain-containing protein [Bacteroidales bacterium]|nr:DUF190 domain-containing protein [Bacteroidales bacterium]